MNQEINGGIEKIFTIHKLNQDSGVFHYLDTTEDEVEGDSLPMVNIIVKQQNIDLSIDSPDVFTCDIEMDKEVDIEQLNKMGIDFESLVYSKLLEIMSIDAMKHFYKIARRNYETIATDLNITTAINVSAEKKTDNRNELINETVNKLIMFIKKIVAYAAVKNRMGGGNSIICSRGIIALLQCHEKFSYITSNNQLEPRLVGRIYDLNVYLDSNLRFDDNIITLFSDKHMHTESGNGLHLIYYLDNNTLKFTIKTIGTTKNISVAIPTDIDIAEILS